MRFPQHSNRREAATSQEAGFSLLEVIAVVLILALSIALSGSFLTQGRTGISLKADAHNVAARLRQVRLSAIREQRTVSAIVDTRRRFIAANDGRRRLTIDPRFSLSVTSAQSEMRGRGISGIRFFPNGGSSGATLEFKHGSSHYDVRVNWLTGRVSTRQVR